MNDTSYGMAKLFVTLPTHQFQDLQLLINQIPVYTLPKKIFIDSNNNRRNRRRRLLQNQSLITPIQKRQSIQQLNPRIQTFREHQKLHPLPVDSIEEEIPHNVSVTIVRGGTGSGKVNIYIYA
jgi:hypothetical protein